MLRKITAPDEDTLGRECWGGLSILSGKALSPREQQVCLLMAAGRSDAEIAERLALNSLTVWFHVTNVIAKLGASSRQEAARLARRSHGAHDVQS